MSRFGLFLGTAPTMGGLFVYARSILDALDRIRGEGHEVEVAFVGSVWKQVLARYPFGSTELRLGQAGLRIATAFMAAPIPGHIARRLAWVLNPIPRQLNQLRCDVWLFPGQDAITYQVDLPVVGTIHDLMHRYEKHFPEVSKNGRWSMRERRFGGIADWSRAILVDSEVGRQHVVESYNTNANKVFALPYVPPSYIYGRESPDFERRYVLPKKFILYPARFLTHKNHKRLISAAAVLRKRIPDISLVFTGSTGEDYEEVTKHAIQLGMLDRITFAGRVPDHDIIGFYGRARAMVMPTFFGPTNIPPLEAFAANCPTAVSNVYGMAEQAGDAALLFDPRSIEQIATVIERLWLDDELCHQLVKKGRRNIERWGPQQFSERLRDILRGVTTGRR